MGGARNITIAMLAVLLLAGCKAPTRMAAKVTEVPRVDLDAGGGNRGYLLGTAPPSSGRKTTRQMFETVVEVPSFYKPTSGLGPAPTMPESQLPETSPEMMDAPITSTPQAYDSYVVQKGDSLWSIAAKSEVYGKASQWRRIFDANRDLLKSPDSVRAGMTLKIPRGEPADDSTTYEDEGITYKK